MIKNRNTKLLTYLLLCGFLTLGFTYYKKETGYNLDKNAHPIGDGVWMSKLEVSNLRYKDFLMGLIEDFEGYMITGPVKTFKDIDGNFYNLGGNVAEMTDQEGIAKGGSWLHLASDCRIESVQQYDQAQIWLGFRFVVIASEAQ